MLWTCCHARGICGTFSFGLIEARTVSSVICQEVFKKGNRILEAQAVVMYSNCHTMFGNALHEQIKLTRYLNINSDEDSCQTNSFSIYI
jgi:hypothetical protein